MKSKLSLLSHNVIVLVEHYEKYLRMYYSDGHYEITINDLKQYIHKNQGMRGYKKPISLRGALLFPTMNQKCKDCRWLNLDYLEEQDSGFLHLLQEKNLLSKSRNMYLKYKEKQLLKDSIFE